MFSIDLNGTGLNCWLFPNIGGTVDII